MLWAMATALAIPRPFTRPSFLSFSGLKATSPTSSTRSSLGSCTTLRCALAWSSLHHTLVASGAPGHARAGAGPFKVALLGASQGVGRPLSLFITQSPLVSHLHLYDGEEEVDSLVSELRRREGDGTVAGFKGFPQLANCLAGMDMVVIVSGAQRGPGMTGQQLFETNAGTVKSLVEAVAQSCPMAWLHLLSEPLDSMVPMAANVLRSFRVFDPARLFGITKVDLILASELVARMKNLDPREVEVPVVGGHDGITILPFLSKTNPSCQFSQEEIEELTVCVRAGTQDTEILARSAAMFLESCLRARDGENDIFDFALVQNAITRVNYFATRFKLCQNGVQYVVGKDFIDMSKYEEAAYHALLPVLKANIDRGLAFAPKDPVVAA